MKLFALLMFLVGLGVLIYFLFEGSQTPPHKLPGSGETFTPDVAESPTSPRDRAPRMVIANFFYPRYDGDEVRWEVEGVNADVRGEDEVRLDKPRLVFYPKKDPNADGPETVVFSSDHGDVRRIGNMAILSGGVTVTTSDGAELKSSELSSNFAEKRIHSASEVAISRGSLRINGRGFDGHIQLEEFRIQEQVMMSLDGAERPTTEPTPAEQQNLPPPTSGLFFFTLSVTCDGPMTMESQKVAPDMPARWRVVFRQQVFISRETLAGESRLFADEVEVILVKAPAEPGQAWPGRIYIAELLATGNVRLEDVQFNASARRIHFQAVDNVEIVTFSGPEQTISFKSARGFRLFETDIATRPRDSAESGHMPELVESPPPVEPTVVTCTGTAVVKRFLPSPGDTTGWKNAVATFDKSVRARSDRVDLLSDALTVELTLVREKKASPDGTTADRERPVTEPDPVQLGRSTTTGDTTVRAELSMLRASGNVLLVEDKLTARADELLWTPSVGTADLMSHERSEVIDEKHRALAKRIRLYRKEGLIVCVNDVDATFLVERRKGIESLFRAPGESEGSPDVVAKESTASRENEKNAMQPPPVEQEWRLKCEILKVKLRPEDNSFESLEAAGHVSIVTERMTASGATFVYSHATGRGSLTGGPLATVANADNVVTADEMEFFSNEKKIILRGRKHISLAYEQRDKDGFSTGKIEHVEARSHGDIVVFQEEGVFYFLEETIVTRPGSWMRSDRMTIYFDPERENRLQRIFAVGNVLVNDWEGVASGDMVEWDFAAGMLVVKAQPYACVSQDDKPLYGEIITIDQDWTRIKSRNPKWGKGRIIIPEGAREQKGGEKWR